MSNQNKTLYDKFLDNPKYRFFLEQITEVGLPLELNNFSYKRDNVTGCGAYMTPDDEGNIRFYVPDILTGDIETYTYGQPPHLKIRDWYLTRWKDPKITENGPAKYTPVKGAGTRILVTPGVAQAFSEKKQIEVLYIVEGFKKALSGWVNIGLPIVGMNGLTGYKEPETESLKLRKEIKEILTICKVKKVCVILDSDLFDLSPKKDKPETTRPNVFYRAALMAKTLFEPFADVYLVHPHKRPDRKQGLDDLLLEHRSVSQINSELPKWKAKPEFKVDFSDGQRPIVRDLEKTIDENKPGRFFGVYKLSAIADYKIKEIFHIADVQQFYDYYRQELHSRSNKKFRFFTYTYIINADNTISQSEDENTRNLNIEERFGRLVRVTEKGNKELSNFRMRVLFQIDSEKDPKRIVEIINYDNVSRIVEVTSKTFVSVTDFQALMITYGDFIWKGSKDDLLDLMTMLFKHEKPAMLLPVLGWNPLDNFFAFSNGIVTSQGFQAVDEYGMVTNNEKTYYFPAWSKFNSRDYDTWKDIKKFSHFKGNKPVLFPAWKKQFTTCYGKNGQIAATYFIASLYSDIIFSHKSGLGFPLLWAAGKPQTGKSTICESLLHMYGEKSDPIGLAGKSTIKYFITRFAQIRNGLVHLDEYSNEKVSKEVKETLKQLYDRIGYGRKAYSNDSRTEYTPVLSSAIVSGEEIPTDNHALFTRAILLLFNKDKYTVEERAEFRKLRDMEERGLTSITVELLCHRQLIEDNFDEAYDQVFNDFYNKFKTRKIEDRMLKNASWIVAPIKILTDHGKIDNDVTYNELLAVFYDNIERQSGYIEANTDIAKFWDIVESLYSRKELSENKGDFRFVDDLLAIRINRLHHVYALEARKLGYAKILDKSTLENYLTNEPYHVEMNDSKGRKKQIRFSGSTPMPALFFRYGDLNIDLKGDSTPLGEEGSDFFQVPADKPF
jgi:hypothetical protein